jgi:hypothetical protein
MVLGYWRYLDSWSRSPNHICQRNLQLDFQGYWPGVRARVSASVDCKHKYIVIIDINLHEHSGDSNGPTIVSNTSTLGL